jgi:hypothetical protein
VTAARGRPALRIARDRITPQEVAAVVAVLLGLAAGADAAALAS